MKRIKFRTTLVLLTAMATLLTACGGSAQKTNNNTDSKAVTGTITGSGSSALLPLAKAAAKSFKAKHSGVSITFNGGGSGTGLKQVSEGSVMIGNSDVAAETKLPKDKAAQLIDNRICTITMALVANNAVTEKVKSLSQKQIKDIFTSKITNWSEVGGPDLPVVLVTRPATSGTRALFKEYAMGGAEESGNKSLETDDSGTLLATVKTNKGAVGYVALSYILNAVEGVSTIDVDGVAPTLENTYSGAYSVWGYEHMYTKGKPQGAVKAFLEYVTSEEFGTQIEAMGYGVTTKMKVKR